MKLNEFVEIVSGKKSNGESKAIVKLVEISDAANNCLPIKFTTYNTNVAFWRFKNDKNRVVINIEFVGFEDEDYKAMKLIINANKNSDRKLKLYIVDSASAKHAIVVGVNRAICLPEFPTISFDTNIQNIKYKHL